jgi:DNA-binding transcriptional MerR regulator
LYYKIGEACRELDIQPYVLRYWETEFPVLTPPKSRSGQRVYSERELAVIRRIKELLYDEGYTIAGAKKKLDSENVQLEQLAGTPEQRPAESPVPPRRAGRTARPVVAQAPRPQRLPLSLDTPRRDRIESRQRGVREALEKARELLALLRD